MEQILQSAWDCLVQLTLKSEKEQIFLIQYVFNFKILTKTFYETKTVTYGGKNMIFRSLH